ncbi:helix-turn-helix domain-containing protein [Streptomyces sp. SA15]|uniref:winged helix-turn-helix transcriptional regulator n=1 Tax=Streptomyces sp. SA15 TaxID=934019 RepID=UPI00211B901B|nr:helix-turn-helix domain-containing protein [Streptomyces sp. SA15]
MSNCSIARTLEVVGEKWTILTLREVWYGSSRFNDLERVLGCPRNLLAARLRMLVEERILATETYKEPGSRSRPKYVITPKGVDLVPAVMGLLQWGDPYRADPEGPAVLARHRGCGAHVLDGHLQGGSGASAAARLNVVTSLDAGSRRRPRVRLGLPSRAVVGPTPGRRQRRGSARSVTGSTSFPTHGNQPL